MGVLLAFTATYCQSPENGKKCEGDKGMNCLEAPKSPAAVEMIIKFNDAREQIANFLGEKAQRERESERRSVSTEIITPRNNR